MAPSLPGVRPLSASAQVAGTSLSNDTFFGNISAIQEALKPNKVAAFSDLVRYVLLYNYGGLWMDNDVLLLRDVYPVTVHVCAHGLKSILPEAH